MSKYFDPVTNNKKNKKNKLKFLKMDKNSYEKLIFLIKILKTSFNTLEKWAAF